MYSSPQPVGSEPVFIYEEPICPGRLQGIYGGAGKEGHWEAAWGNVGVTSDGLYTMPGKGQAQSNAASLSRSAMMRVVDGGLAGTILLIVS